MTKREFLDTVFALAPNEANAIMDVFDEYVESNEPHWIPVTERLPKEEDSIFARYYGTDRWRKSMFRKKSREVIVTSVFEDGELHTEVAHTTDGEWHVGVNVVPRTVIAWMPLPEPSQVAADIARIVENGKDMRVIEAAQPTPDQNGDLWITVQDIDKVTCIYVQESKSKFCRIFYEER